MSDRGIVCWAAFLLIVDKKEDADDEEYDGKTSSLYNHTRRLILELTLSQRSAAIIAGNETVMESHRIASRRTPAETSIPSSL